MSYVDVMDPDFCEVARTRGTAVVVGQWDRTVDAVVRRLVQDGWSVILPVRSRLERERRLAGIDGSSQLRKVLADPQGSALAGVAALATGGTGFDAVILICEADIRLTSLGDLTSREWVEALTFDMSSHLDAAEGALRLLRDDGTYVIATVDSSHPGEEAGIIPVIAVARSILARMLDEREPSKRITVRSIVLRRVRSGDDSDPWVTEDGTVAHVGRAPAEVSSLLSSRRTPESMRGGLPGWRLQRVRGYIESHIEERITLADMAGAAQLSPFHFCRCFAATVGLSPGRYLVERRVERAKRLLGEGGLSLVEVALACGFAGQSHFTTAFRKSAGETPGRWRERVLDEANQIAAALDDTLPLPRRSVWLRTARPTSSVLVDAPGTRPGADR